MARRPRAAGAAAGRRARAVGSRALQHRGRARDPAARAAGPACRAPARARAGARVPSRRAQPAGRAVARAQRLSNTFTTCGAVSTPGRRTSIPRCRAIEAFARDHATGVRPGGTTDTYMTRMRTSLFRIFAVAAALALLAGAARGGGPAADLPRGAEAGSGHRVRAFAVGSDAGARAAGARGAAAVGVRVRPGERQQLRLDGQHQSEDPRLDELQLRRTHLPGVAAAVPAAERRRARPGEGAGRAVRLLARHRAAGPHHPHRGRVFRRAAGRVQRRARAAAEDRGVRAARAGQAQLRGRHRDHHRHQRSAGQVRPDRRHRDPGATTTSTAGAPRSLRSSAACRRA